MVNESIIGVCGLGWIDKQRYGCVKKSICVHYNTDNVRLTLPDKKDMFSYPFDNFGRLDLVSKMTCYAVGLALKDAGINCSVKSKHNIGILGTNSAGCLSADERYFKDYLDNGRSLGRGNLFIYTLPSSSLSEAAIHYGLEGPMFYTTGHERSIAVLMDLAARMIDFNEVTAALLGEIEAEYAFFLVLGKPFVLPGGMLCTLPQAENILSQNLALASMIKEFSHLSV